MVLMMAGIDTTSYVIGETTRFLVRHPEWLEALWQEQQRLIAEFGEDIDRKVRDTPVATPHRHLESLWAFLRICAPGLAWGTCMPSPSQCATTGTCS